VFDYRSWLTLAGAPGVEVGVKFNGNDASPAEVVTACTDGDGNFWAPYDTAAAAPSFSSIMTDLMDSAGDQRGPGHMYTQGIGNCNHCHAPGGEYGLLFQPAPAGYDPAPPGSGQ
jgi:hypothetical protein